MLVSLLKPALPYRNLWMAWLLVTLCGYQLDCF